MFEKLDHINLTVHNLDESIEWYGKVFGFEQVERGIAMGSPFSIIARNDFALCIYEEPKRKSAAVQGDSEYHQLYHFGIRVSDVEAWRKVVRINNLKLSYGGPVAYPKSISWYVIDPSGHKIEVSYTKEGLWA